MGVTLGLKEGEIEERQCIALHVAAEILWKKLDRPPSLEDVRALGTQIPTQLLEQARLASSAVGDAPPTIS